MKRYLLVAVFLTVILIIFGLYLSRRVNTITNGTNPNAKPVTTPVWDTPSPSPTPNIK